MRMDYVEAVLDVVALIPAGAVVAYGDVADLLGSGGARQVGAVMSRHGSAVPWWRVLKAGGFAPPGHEREALTRYLLERTPLLGNYAGYLQGGDGRWRVDLMTARWAPSDGEFELIDAVAERLERTFGKLSVPNDEMTV